MNVHDVLRTRKVEIDTEIEALRNEKVQIDAALAVLEGEPEKPIKREDAIIAAVKSGKQKPQDIHKFIKRQIGLDMNIGSLRSTLSRLKSEGRIDRDASGWKM